MVFVRALYKETKENIADYVNLWQKFHHDIKDYCITYEQLEKILVADGLIEPVPPQEEGPGDENPF